MRSFETLVVVFIGCSGSGGALSPLDKSLMDAAGEGNGVAVAAALKAGANINCRSEEAGETPLHTAGIWGKSDVVKTLLEAGADVNARATGEHSLSMMPLHWMVYPGYTEAVKLMIAAGSDVNAIVFRENGERVTALDIAELYTNDENPSKNHIATAALLVEAGAMHAVEVDAVIND